MAKPMSSGDSEMAEAAHPLAMNHDCLCVAALPDAGLANKLLVWARGLVFAHLNSIPFVTYGWRRLKIGPILRGESSLRYYGGFFLEDGLAARWTARLRLLGGNVVMDPPVAPLAVRSERVTYVHHSVPPWHDYFGGIREHRQFVRSRFSAYLAPAHVARANAIQPPAIAIHVRHGDYRPLRPGDDFSRLGSTRTPLAYFTALIERLRRVSGRALPVSVFSDGRDADLGPLLSMPGVKRAATGSDLGDLLLMSRARLIVASAGSTYSYWAGYLADAPLLLHPDHVHAPIRDGETNAKWFEGGVRDDEEWPSLLLENVRALCER